MSLDMDFVSGLMLVDSLRRVIALVSRCKPEGPTVRSLVWWKSSLALKTALLKFKSLVKGGGERERFQLSMMRFLKFGSSTIQTGKLGFREGRLVVGKNFNATGW